MIFYGFLCIFVTVFNLMFYQVNSELEEGRLETEVRLGEGGRGIDRIKK